MRIAETKLKKQSQFASGQNGVKLYLKGVYGNMMAWGMRKFKANFTILCRNRSQRMNMNYGPSNDGRG